MMDYKLFKKIIEERILDYLPPIFADAEVKVNKVNKINEEKDALIVLLKGDDMFYAAPTIYLDDAYEGFSENEDLEEILHTIAYIIMRYTGFIPREMVEIDFNTKKDCIVMNLINKEKNSAMLEKVPHKEMLDMAIIYRFVMGFDEHGVNTVLLTNELMEDLEITLSELESLALKNTLRLFPAQIGKFSKEFYIMTNEHKIHGATTITYPDAVNKLAEMIEEDFYIIPSSIHEVLAVPLKYAEGADLYSMLEEGNNNFTDDSEILSDSIYYYSQETKEITKAASFN